MKNNRFVRFALSLGLVWLILFTDTALAQNNVQMEELQRKLEEQQRTMEQQRQMLEQQQRMVDALHAEMQRLKQASVQSSQQAEEAQKVAAEVAEQAQAKRQFAKDVQVKTFGVPLLTPVDTKDDPRFKLTVSGQVNRQIYYGIDGNTEKLYFTDSDNLPTLLNVTAETKVNDDLNLGAVIEASYQDNRPLRVNQNNERSGFDFSSRKAEIVLDSKRFGKLSAGKGFASSFTLNETDLSGTQPASLLSVGNLAGGLLFYSNDLNDYTNVSVSDVFVDIEQASLVNRLRYDSPRYHGFQISGSAGANQRSDVTLRWKQAIGDFQFSSASSYQRNSLGGLTDWRVDGILGTLHKPTGLNLAVGAQYSEVKEDGHHFKGFVVKAGWRKRLLGFGETRFSTDLTRTWDVSSRDENATSVGAFVVQDVDDWAMQFYGGYRYFNLDRDNFVDLDSIHVPVVGARKWF